MDRDIKERNSFKEQMKAMARELTDLITEKARAIYERFKEFRGSVGDTERTRSDGGTYGKATGRAGRKGSDHPKYEGRIGRIHELKRAADDTEQDTQRTEQKINNTDGEIAVTDNRIAELRELVQQKEAGRDERIRRLKERRSASLNDGGDAGSDRGIGEKSSSPDRDKLRVTKDDIGNFLRELDSKERSSEEKRDDYITERANRETERERSRAEKEREIREGEHKAPESSKGNEGRGRSKGHSR